MEKCIFLKMLEKRANLGIPKKMKNAVSISIDFSVDILIRNENIISQEHKTKQTV